MPRIQKHDRDVKVSAETVARLFLTDENFRRHAMAHLRWQLLAGVGHVCDRIGSETPSDIDDAMHSEDWSDEVAATWQAMTPDQRTAAIHLEHILGAVQQAVWQLDPALEKPEGTE